MVGVVAEIASQERYRVLVVDDNDRDRRAVAAAVALEAARLKAAALDGAFVEILEARSLAHAREILRGGEMACVFLDHDLPDGTTLDLLSELRSSEAAAPVVVLTGERDDRIAAEALRAGAIATLPKNALDADLVARSLRAALLFLQVQREKQAALTELRVRDRAIAAASNGIVIADARNPEYPLVYVNPAFLRLTGYTEKEILGRNCRFLYGPDTDPAARQTLRDSIHQGRECQTLILNYRKDGTTFQNEVTVSPVRDAGGVLTHFIGIQTDVTRRYEAEAEKERLLAEQKARAERAALLNQIGTAIRSARDPAQVLETAVRELAEALGADRCYYVAYDEETDTATVGPEWRRASLPAVSGRHTLSRFAANSDPLYLARRTHAVSDLSEDPAACAVGVCSLVRVFLVSDRGLTGLEAAMSDAPRVWTDAEISLVEAVATQTQTALESARMVERERNIAAQLQSALQPALPNTVSGLAVAKYYEAALEEAGVGGDFYDVFLVSEECTALVVGDLMGKGLAAAAQVATVRNMLRAFLYSQDTVAAAVAELNRVLAEQELLTGFATLFVGVYDSTTGLLKYVNAGQEPALVRRAGTGRIEMLDATGPVLGVVPEARYQELCTTLSPGDAVAVYTDGLTEVGLSRKAMLGVDGVAALLEAPFTTAEELASRLIAGVKVFDEAAARDDLCLLVGVIQPQETSPGLSP